MKVIWEYFLFFLEIFFALVGTFFRLILPKIKKSIRGQVVVITGAAQGIGRCLALEFAKCGAKVALLDINKNGMNNVKNEIKALGVECCAYMCDVTSVDDVRKVAREVQQDLGRVDILVNNAGVLIGKPLLKLNDADIIKTFDVNVMSYFWTLREYLPSMVERNQGHIVTMASTSCFGGCELLVDYTASKYAVNGLVAGLQLEMKKYGKTGIQFSTVYPSWTNTSLVHREHFKIDKSLDKRLLPEFVAKTVIDGVLKEKMQIFVPPKAWLAPVKNLLVPELVHDVLEKYSDGGMAEVDNMKQR